MKKFSYLLSCVFIPVFLYSITPDLDGIAMAIRVGNASALAKYFDNSVEITILGNEKVYSKTQAEMVMKDFFARNKPKSFNLIHRGSSSKGSQYGIGTLVTANGNFRVYIYVRQVNASYLIQEMSFEKD